MVEHDKVTRAAILARVQAVEEQFAVIADLWGQLNPSESKCTEKLGALIGGHQYLIESLRVLAMSE